MPSLRLSEIEELMKEEDELTEVELRRRREKEKKLRPCGLKYIKTNNGGELDSTDVDG